MLHQFMELSLLDFQTSAPKDVRSPVSRLSGAINQELLRRNSPLRLTGTCTGYSYAIAEFRLTNKDTAAVEDAMRVGPGVARHNYLVALSVLLFS